MNAVLELAPPDLTAITGADGREDHSLAGSPRRGRIEVADDTVPGIPAILARNFVMAVGWDWHLPTAVIGVLKAAAAELVDNAVTHALDHTSWPNGTRVVLVDVDLYLDRVVLTVRDPDPVLPVIPKELSIEDLLAALADPDGTPEDVEKMPRGLFYLDGICTALRPVAQPTGKAMLAEIALPSPADRDVTPDGAAR